MPRVLSVLAGAALLLLTGCGAGNFGSQPAPMPPVTPPALSPPVTLDGNWFLAGARTPATYPILSTALFVSGTQITGQASFDEQCSPTSLGGGVLQLTGTIANDGTFTMTSGAIKAGTVGMLQLDLSGNSPTQASPTLWTGNYNLNVTFDPPLNGAACTYNHGASLVAQAISPLTGTYSGLASSGPLQSFPFGKTATVTMVITQGAPTLVTRNGISRYLLPLTGSITFNGSPCATTGVTSSSPLSSQIEGDRAEIFFKMADGSNLSVLGNLTDRSATALSVNLGEAPGSPCTPGVSMTTLVRQ